jgi:glycosyltransferase involved in cell wall biosynthesis
VLSVPNSKLGAARNFGVSQVETEWVAFLDADDLWKEDKLERQMEELARQPRADICYTGHVPFSMENDAVRLHQAVPGCPAESVVQKLHKDFIFLPSSAVIRRSVLLDIGGFSPDPGVSEDWDLWLRLAHAGVQFVACEEPLVLYRIHPNSLTADKLKQRIKNVRLYREQILPYLSGQARRAALKHTSDENASIAYLMKEKGDSRCLRTMTSSIVGLPFGNLWRYKAWLGMLLVRLKAIPQPHHK